MERTPKKPITAHSRKFFLKSFLQVLFFTLLAIITLSSFYQDEQNLEVQVEDTVPQADTLVDDNVTGLTDTLSDDKDVEVMPVESEVEYIRGEYTSQQIRRGERLFNGLVPFASGQHDCVSCHYTEPQQEMNWNPSAYEMAVLWHQKPDYSIMDIMNNPVSVRLMEDHAGMDITEEEQHLLEAYYTKLIERGPEELKAYPVRAFIFWGLGALMLLALIDLIITRKI